MMKTLIQLAQKGMGADKKFSDASRQRDELIQVIGDLKDPTKLFPLLEKMGHNTRKITEDFLLAELEKEQMTTEQREVLDLRKKIKNMEDADSLKKTEDEKQEVSVTEAKYRAEFDKQFTEALKDEDIPKTKESVAKMAYYMEAAMNEGTDISARDAASLVKQDMESYYKDMAKNLEPEQLIKLFGEDLPKKFKNFDLSKITTPQDKNKVSEENKTPPKKKKGKKRLTNN